MANNPDNLPVKPAAQNVALLAEEHGSLVGRGLMALRRDKDALYRQARAVFDRGYVNRNVNVAENPAISSVFKIFQRLADENYGKAYYPLSILYSGRNDIEDGNNPARHYAQLALEWCLANQANDDAELWCDLGDMHNSNGFEGYGVPQSKEIAEAWYRKAAEQGYARGQWELSFFLYFDDEKHPGSYWMELAAMQGNVEYQITLADCYDFLTSQYQKAVYWYNKAADQGDERAQYILGGMFKAGRGVSQDDKQAVFWFTKAANQGHEDGQFDLAMMFLFGRGVQRDDKQAANWLLKASEQDHRPAQYWLGKMYEFGCGVEQSDEQAAYWYEKVEEDGYSMEIDENDQEHIMFDEDFVEYGEGIFIEDFWAWACFSSPPDESNSISSSLVAVTVTHTGFIKSESLTGYLSPLGTRRGTGVISKTFIASTHDYILCFTSNGYAHKLKVQDLPQKNDVLCDELFYLPELPMLGIREDSKKVISILPVKAFREDQFVFFATSHGTVKKTSLTEFSDPCKTCLPAIHLDEDDYLIGAEITNGTNDVVLISNFGKVVMFDETDVRAMGRLTRGVRGMKLQAGQQVLSLLIADNDQQTILVATENGRCKRTALADYLHNGRGTQGANAIPIPECNDKVVAAKLVNDEDEIILITTGGTPILTCVKEIRELDQTAQGSALINLSEGEKLTGLEKLAAPIVHEID